MSGQYLTVTIGIAGALEEEVNMANLTQQANRILYAGTTPGQALAR